MDYTIFAIIMFCTYVAENQVFVFAKVVKAGDERYEKCGSPQKVCYGESEECVQTKSCTILATITTQGPGSRFDYNVSFLDKCRRGVYEPLFYAMATGTFNAQGNLDCSQDLTFRDFRLFFFWKDTLCPFGKKSDIWQTVIDTGETKLKYREQCEMQVYGNPGNKLLNTLDGSIELDLNQYLNNYVRVAGVEGKWKEAYKPFGFPDDIRLTTDPDKILYLGVVEDHRYHNGATYSGYFFLLFIAQQLFYHIHSFLFVNL